MANELINQLNDILSDKNTNLLPENLKEGVTCLGITGTFQGGSGEYGKITINKANISNVRVENLSGAGYNFELTDDGYYTSTNKGRDNTACVGKLYFTVNTDDEVKAEILCSSEQGYDYAQISKVDTATAYGTSSSAEANSNTLFSTKGTDYTTPKEVSFGTLSKGEHYVYIKYRKDSSSSQDLDQLKIKMQLGQSTEEVNVKLYTSVEDLKADTSLQNKDFGLVVSSNANHFMSALYQWVNNEWLMSYDLATPTSIDNDLKPENILTGIDILGVEGTALNIDNSRINVTHKDIRAGKYTFNRAGQPIIGSLNVPQIEYSDTATQLEKIELNIDDLASLSSNAYYTVIDNFVMYIKDNRLNIIGVYTGKANTSLVVDIDNSIDSITAGVKDYFNQNTYIILLSGDKGYWWYEYNYKTNKLTYKTNTAIDRTNINCPRLNLAKPYFLEAKYNVSDFSDSVTHCYKFDSSFNRTNIFTYSNRTSGGSRYKYGCYSWYSNDVIVICNSSSSSSITRGKVNPSPGDDTFTLNFNKDIVSAISNSNLNSLVYNQSKTYCIKPEYQKILVKPVVNGSIGNTLLELTTTSFVYGACVWLADDIFLWQYGVYKIISNDNIVKLYDTNISNISRGLNDFYLIDNNNKQKFIMTGNTINVPVQVTLNNNILYNTQTANVTKEDIPLGKIAYTNTGKIIGTLQTDTGKNYTELLTTANNIANTTLEDDSTTITFDVDTEMRCLQKALKILKGVV